MNKKFEFLEHTADTKIKAYGKNLEEAFINVALATTTVMTDLDEIKLSNSKKIVIKSKNEKSLLYDFLEEILFLLDTEGFLVGEVKDLSIEKIDNRTSGNEDKTYGSNNKDDGSDNKFRLICTLNGDFADKGYEVHTTIKAITYSEMEITQNDDGVIIQIVHDL